MKQITFTNKNLIPHPVMLLNDSEVERIMEALNAKIGGIDRYGDPINSDLLAKIEETLKTIRY